MSREQTATALQALNRVGRDLVIDAASERDSLERSQFYSVISEKSVRSWDNLLAGLESYGRSLDNLARSREGERWRQESLELADTFQRVGREFEQGFDLFPNSFQTAVVGAGFLRLGELLLEAHARSDAASMARHTDATVSEICVHLAELIGANATHNLRGTARAQWDQQMARKQLAFLQAPTPELKREIAAQFAESLESQEKMDELLKSLRRSYLTLARSHRALASRRKIEFDEAIREIRQELRATASVHQDLKDLMKVSRNQ